MGQQNTTKMDQTNTSMAVATAFFHACERGEGWSSCQQFTTPNATFTVQAMDALPGPAITTCETAEQYSDWMKGVAKNMGDKATYRVDACAFDAETSTAIFVATFGGFSHYVYSM